MRDWIPTAGVVLALIAGAACSAPDEGAKPPAGTQAREVVAPAEQAASPTTRAAERTAITVGGVNRCGLRADGTMTCGGSTRVSSEDPPRSSTRRRV